MFVIGYLDQTRGNRVRIPDFHTGHLGFMPGLRARFFGPVKEGPDIATGGTLSTSAEMVVTPFDSQSSIYRVGCKFIEKKGVLRRFVEVLSNDGINILSLESASANLARDHVVFATIDLVGSNIFPGLP